MVQKKIYIDECELIDGDDYVYSKSKSASVDESACELSQ